ncbi:hypothetical protein R7127_13465 [Vibrio sp. 1159]|uniref:hypothetical protein n=1 Tax=Vibrio sp. 1159 TaxID=3074545 RepID=UPI0029655B4F|nr:hypothetical protein [Vibrio sp. 1159]MDW2321285.1 hypothetical protein [Vibrio sp. 1159]
MSMTQEEINRAVDGVMELRPTGTRLPKEQPKDSTVTQRMSDVQFQQELAAIMKDETLVGSAFYFRNQDVSKGGRKNLNFNRYPGGVK